MAEYEYTTKRIKIIYEDEYWPSLKKIYIDQDYEPGMTIAMVMDNREIRPGCGWVTVYVVSSWGPGVERVYIENPEDIPRWLDIDLT